MTTPENTAMLLGANLTLHMTREAASDAEERAGLWPLGERSRETHSTGVAGRVADARSLAHASLVIRATLDGIIVHPMSWRLVHNAHVREVEADRCGEVRVRSLLQEDLRDQGLPAEGSVLTRRGDKLFEATAMSGDRVSGANFLQHTRVIIRLP